MYYTTSIVTKIHIEIGEYIMIISQRIYKIMEDKKISQIEFSRKTGISQSTISDWRRKGTNPSADKLMIICEALDCSVYDLLLDTKNKKHKEYKATETVVIDKNSRDYKIIEAYNKLELDNQKRLEGYLDALSGK